MGLANYAAGARQIAVYAALEPSFGHFTMPEAHNLVGALDMPAISQADKFIDSKEKVDSRSRPERGWAGREAGSLSLNVYCRPSGSLGVAPVEDVLLYAACGGRVVNAGASVVYSLADAKPSLSLAIKEGHVVHYIAGCKIGDLKAALNKSEFFAWTVSGMFREVFRAGTAVAGFGSTTTEIVLISGEARLFDVGALVVIGDDDNDGNGYRITAVDVAANVITLAEPCASAADETTPAAKSVASSSVCITRRAPRR